MIGKFNSFIEYDLLVCCIKNFINSFRKGSQDLSREYLSHIVYVANGTEQLNMGMVLSF